MVRFKLRQGYRLDQLANMFHFAMSSDIHAKKWKHHRKFEHVAQLGEPVPWHHLQPHYNSNLASVNYF